MVFIKKSNIFSWVLLDKLSKKSLVFDVLGRKECFSHKESKVSLKTPKNPNVTKRLVHVLVTNSNTVKPVLSAHPPGML